MSKTDHDATFMCVKEDSMIKEPKSAYNLQITMNKQFVIIFGIFKT
ncbi:hypothetical protein [Liquorilactobacillus satsumensis]